MIPSGSAAQALTVAEAFRCPQCGRTLVPVAAETLRCEEGHTHPVIGGIPRFVPSEAYAQSFGIQWNRWSRVQLDSLNGTHIFRDRFNRYLGDPGTLAGLRVLDAGCGAGAFIDVVASHAAEVVGFDLSSAVEAAGERFESFPNVVVAQADIYAPPVPPQSFDLVYCFGVLQHTPDPKRAFRSLVGLVKPGGRLAVWIYERAWWEPLRPRHLLRAYTTRRLEPGAKALQFVQRYAPRAIKLRRDVKRLPGGRALARAIPVPDVEAWPDRAAEQLSDDQLLEWTILDTHDWLITEHDLPQRPEEVREWFRGAGFEVERRDAEAIAMVGTKG